MIVLDIFRIYRRYNNVRLLGGLRTCRRSIRCRCISGRSICNDFVYRSSLFAVGDRSSGLCVGTLSGYVISKLVVLVYYIF